ncbi:MAG: hypothetical protein M5U12_37270 [Verrucomicrobia bacterium]|nr:hypothetical protein [Verrucomicrobiota bacterium]
MKTSMLRVSGWVLATGLGVALVGCRSDATGGTVAAPPPAPASPVASSPAPAAVPVPASAGAPAALPPAAAPPSEAAALPLPDLSTNAPIARVEPQPPELSPAVREVVDMAQAQVGETVLLEFVRQSAVPFELGADDLVYLKDIGVPDAVVTAMLQRTSQLHEQAVVAAPVTGTVEAAAAAPEPAAASDSASVYARPVTAAAPAAPPGEPAPGAPPPVTNNYYYASLAPYGSWLYIEPYGWCWQPTVAVTVTDWRPYSHGGRWLYTTGGWYWQSYYSWGWAPFHYGNWYIHPGCGWVWVPGSVWAPAWVTWRYTDAYCGWAPLPPGCGWTTGIGLTYWGRGVSVGFSFGLSSSWYTFVGWNDCWRPYPYRYRLPHHHHTVVYNQSTVINNYYVDNSKNMVVNHGVPTRDIPASARRDLRRLDIKDVPAGRSVPVRPEQTSLDGRQVAAYRPAVPADLKASSARPSEAPYRPVRTRGEAPHRRGHPLCARANLGDSTRPSAGGDRARRQPGCARRCAEPEHAKPDGAGHRCAALTGTDSPHAG